MGLVAEIARSVGVDVHHAGSTELILDADIVRFLDAVRSRKMCVLGLEGFRLVEGCLVPDMDAIADFSSISYGTDHESTVAEALRFLSNIEESDLLYDVTLGIL